MAIAVLLDPDLQGGHKAEYDGGEEDHKHSGQDEHIPDHGQREGHG